MGVGRAIYVLLFPIFFTVAGIALSLVTFFSSYEHATGLKNVHFMTLDLANIQLGGVSSEQILGQANISTVYTVGANGWCTGNNTQNMETCYTPHEPFYFDFEEILDQAGLSSLTSSLPSEIQKYNTLSKDATLGLWGCYLAAIILGFLQLFCGVLAMCSTAAAWIAEIFATLSFLAAALGAALATGVYNVYKSKINEVVGQFGVKATLDSAALGVAWASAAAFLVADVLYLMSSCCCASRRRQYVVVPEKEEVFH